MSKSSPFRLNPALALHDQLRLDLLKVFGKLASMKRSYADVIRLLQESGNNRLYVTAHYKNGRHEWLPVDKAEYLRQLLMISNPEIDYPCYFEVERDGEMFIHTKGENHHA